MGITRLSLSNRVVLVVSVVLLMAGGLIAYFTLPQAEDPGFTVRIAQVITIYPGASPERVRDLVTEPLENSINEMSQLESLSSTSRQSVSVIRVEVAFEHSDLDPIWDELADKVAAVADQLPEGINGPRIEDNFGDVFGVLMTITGEGYTIQELDQIAEDVRREALQLSEVGRVDIYGVPDQEVAVAYDRTRMQNLSLTPYALAGAIQQTNVVRPAGSLNLSPEDVPIESSGNFPTLSALAETLVPVPGGQGQLVALRDIAGITLVDEDPPPSIVRFNGDPAVVLAINMKSGGRVTVLGDQIAALAAELEPRYPIGVEFDFLAFQPEIVSGLVNDFTNNVIMAIVIVIAVMLLAAGIRSGLVVAALIPTSMIGTLLIMMLFGITINQMSLAALIIVLGMLVDSAIVFAESTTLELERGRDPQEAVVHVARELRIPLLTSALTTAAAFLPIALAQNNAGEYTRPIVYVVTIALLLAWLLTLTLIPLLAVKLLPGYVARRKQRATERGDTTSTIESPFHRVYGRMLAWMLKYRVATLAILSGILVASLALFTRVPVSFFPDTNYPIYTMEIALPRGTTIQETARVAEDVELFLATDVADQVELYGTFVGGGIPRYRLNVNPENSRPEHAFFLVRTTSYEAIEELFAATRRFVADLAPDAELELSSFSYGPASSAPIEVRLSGTDRDLLYRNVALVQERLSAITGVTNVRDDWGNRIKTLNVQVREASARRVGVTHRDVATSLQAATVGLEVSEFRGADQTIPIVLRDSQMLGSSVEQLESTLVYSEAAATSVPLQQVAQIDLQWQPSIIRQRDRVETIVVQADTLGGTNPITVAEQLRPWLEQEAQDWPVGFGYDFGGEIEGSADANSAIVAQLPLVLFIIVLLLVFQFNSLRLPAVVLLTIPFGLVGVVVGLFITNSTFSFMALLGLVSLSGVVLNNSIVLLDKINIEIAEGRSPLVAIFRASFRKIRPIILTSVTTITGLVPLLLFGGPMWEPMASALMFGLAFATVLTLGLVPVLYSLLHRVQRPETMPPIQELL